MTDFLRTLFLVNGYVACALVMLFLLLTTPAHADDGGVVGAALSVAAYALGNHNAGDPGYDGGDND